MIFDDIKSFEIDRNQDKKFGIKSGIVWGHSADNNGIFPIMYLSKPKGISQEDFDLLLAQININFRIPKT